MIFSRMILRNEDPLSRPDRLVIFITKVTQLKLMAPPDFQQRLKDLPVQYCDYVYYVVEIRPQIHRNLYYASRL